MYVRLQYCPKATTGRIALVVKCLKWVGKTGETGRDGRKPFNMQDDIPVY